MKGRETQRQKEHTKNTTQRHPHTERRWSCDNGGRDCFYKPKNIRDCQHIAEVKRDMKQILTYCSQEGMNPADTYISDFKPPNFESRSLLF